MPRTTILEPLDEEVDNETKKKAKKDLESIKNMMDIFLKNNTKKTFDEILNELNLSEFEYMLALRSSISATTVFYKRTSEEVAINPYNLEILQLLQSNMDIQFILNPYACISYIANYISKPSGGMSKLLRDAAKEVSEGNFTHRDRLRKIANVFINGSTMSAQEAVYDVLSIPVSRCSRATAYINTRPINERAVMLKTNKQLAELDPESTDIYNMNCQQYYAIRVASLEDTCLAEFMAYYPVPILHH